MSACQSKHANLLVLGVVWRFIGANAVNSVTLHIQLYGFELGGSPLSTLVVPVSVCICLCPVMGWHPVQDVPHLKLTGIQHRTPFHLHRISCVENRWPDNTCIVAFLEKPVTCHSGLILVEPKSELDCYSFNIL